MGQFSQRVLILTMDELASIRDLIRNEGPRYKHPGIAHVFRKVIVDTPPERIVMRWSYPYPPTGVVLALGILGVLSAYAISFGAMRTSVLHAVYQSSGRLAPHRISPSKSDTCRGALNRVFLLTLGARSSAMSPARNQLSITQPGRRRRPSATVAPVMPRRYDKSNRYVTPPSSWLERLRRVSSVL